jgi:hypothetical protein
VVSQLRNFERRGNKEDGVINLTNGWSAVVNQSINYLLLLISIIITSFGNFLDFFPFFGFYPFSDVSELLQTLKMDTQVQACDMTTSEVCLCMYLCTYVCVLRP